MALLLVVDDFALSRDPLVTLLTDEGHSCLTAGDGRSALALAQDHPVDLVLLDIAMPGMSGLEVLDVLRRSRQAIDLPIIMVTAHGASEEVVNTLEHGANDYVTKPIDLRVLLARIETQLRLRELARFKDQFLRVASHDLKNPLTAILGAAGYLGESFPPGEPMTTEGLMLMDIIGRRARQMRRLIGDFLDMGALADGRLVLEKIPIDLGAMAALAVSDNLFYGHQKGIDLCYLHGAPIPPVVADPARITQVLDNLVGNAIKSCSAGDRVEVLAHTGEIGVAVEVRDTGPGIAEADFGKLFVKHARLGHRPTAGERSSGLGLAMCRDLIEAHGGRISARSAEGGGAVFWFELPR